MKEQLINSLYIYVHANHPDILIPLQEEQAVTAWLKDQLYSIQGMMDTMQAEGRPVYIIEELCMKELTESLGISKYNYISAIMEEAFEETRNRLLTSGLLTYEILNLIDACAPAFSTFGFTDDSDNDRHLKAAVAGIIHHHLSIPIML